MDTYMHDHACIAFSESKLAKENSTTLELWPVAGGEINGRRMALPSKPATPPVYPICNHHAHEFLAMREANTVGRSNPFGFIIYV